MWYDGTTMPTVLLLSLVTEVGATIALRLSDGFTKLGPSVAVILGYGLSFVLLSLVLKQLSVGYVYAVWSAAGTALIALIGIAVFGEAASVLKFGSLALIIAGVVGLNLAGGAH